MQKYTVVVSEEGTICWYKEGTEILHREGGPAKEWASGTKFWYQNDELHRLDGPAADYSNGQKSWYINGRNYSEEEYWKKIGELNHSNDCSSKIVEIDGKKYRLIPVDDGDL